MRFVLQFVGLTQGTNLQLIVIVNRCIRLNLDLLTTFAQVIGESDGFIEDHHICWETLSSVSPYDLAVYNYLAVLAGIQ